MDAKDSFFVFAMLLLSLGLFDSLSLTYCVWNKQTEVASQLQNELHSKLQSELAGMQTELNKLQNEMKKMNGRVQLGASEHSKDKNQLKRNVRQADEDTETQSAAEILTNTLTEINEIKPILM